MAIGRMQMNRQLYQMGGQGIMQMAPQESPQSVEKELAGDPKKAFMLLVKMLMDQGIPEEEAIKIAKEMIQSVAQGGMSEMEDERVEARFGGRMGYANGGLSTLVDRQQYGFGSFVKSAVKGVTGVVKGAASAVKSIAKSPIGQIALAVAAPYAIGYLAPGFATLGGSGMMGAALRGGISNMAISALTGQKIDPKNVLLSAGISGGLQGYQSGAFGGNTNLGQNNGSFFNDALTPQQIASQAPSKTLSQSFPGMSNSQILSAQNVPVDYLDMVTQGSMPAQNIASGALSNTATNKSAMDLIKTVGSLDSNTSFLDRGQAVMDLGGKALDTVFYKSDGKGGRELDKMAALAAGSMIPSYLSAQNAQEDLKNKSQFNEAAYNSERDKYMQRYQSNLSPSNFGITMAAKGGRMGYKDAGIVSLTDENSGVIYKDPDTGETLTTTEFLRRAQEDEDRDNVSLTDEESGVVYEDPKTGKPLTTEEFLKMSQEDEDKELDFGASSITLPKKKTFRERSMEIAVPKQINREMEDKFENYLKKLVTGKKDGGRIGYAEGMSSQMAMAADMIKRGMDEDTISSITNLTMSQIQDIKQSMTQPVQKANGGRMGFMMGTEVPMRQNQGGITELDYRKTGGFVPVGVKEKADDVPAMLSKNEFVFTADAVRAAGGGLTC
jgi:hypothetical protein